MWIFILFGSYYKLWRWRPKKFRDDDDDNIEELTLPICIIGHTETNIILSVSCPNNLEYNLKQIIIDTFESMKPKTIKGPEEDKSLADTTIEERDNKILY